MKKKIVFHDTNKSLIVPRVYKIFIFIKKEHGA